MSGSLELLGMLNPGMAGFAAAPAFDVGSALGAMNPGMTGFGGGATNVGGFDAMAPLTDNSSWLDRNMPSSKQLGDALGALNKAGGTGKGAGGAGERPPMPGQAASGGVGRPTVQSLGPLLQLLNQRRDLLLQSATGGVGAGAPQGAKPTAGLLGF
jgi:hypothetical protein